MVLGIAAEELKEKAFHRGSPERQPAGHPHRGWGQHTADGLEKGTALHGVWGHGDDGEGRGWVERRSSGQSAALRPPARKDAAVSGCRPPLPVRGVSPEEAAQPVPAAGPTLPPSGRSPPDGVGPRVPRNSPTQRAALAGRRGNVPRRAGGRRCGRTGAMASPPLAAGSGGEGSSGSTGPDPSDRQLSALFEQAAERLPALLHSASKEQLLYLYARYKQVKFGTCNTPKPSFFDFEGKQKWEAWKALGDTSPHQAMQEYVATVKKLDPSWNPQTTEKRGKESKTAFGGPVVSSLYQEETIREEDKNIFDYCRENNIDYVTKAIQSKNVDVNVADEEGRALLHWACDRGHKELVSVLLQHAANVNSQDGEGQTALHYASACEFSDIVELLLQSGADPTLRDKEGCLPEEVTDCKAITSALQQHTAGKV